MLSIISTIVINTDYTQNLFSPKRIYYFLPEEKNVKAFTMSTNVTLPLESNVVLKPKFMLDSESRSLTIVVGNYTYKI